MRGRVSAASSGAARGAADVEGDGFPSPFGPEFHGRGSRLVLAKCWLNCAHAGVLGLEGRRAEVTTGDVFVCPCSKATRGNILVEPVVEFRPDRAAAARALPATPFPRCRLRTGQAGRRPPYRIEQHTVKKTALALSALTVAVAAVTTSASASAQASKDTAKPTIVLVHGAFADGSSWTLVTKKLQASGYRVVVPANPLRGLESDSAYLAHVLKTIQGPVVLVGHSYGGEVITNAAASNPQVKALVYAAAIAPEKGESANDILSKFPGSRLPEALNPVTYPAPSGGEGTDLYVKPDKFRAVFAADVPSSDTAVMAAAQRPIDASSLEAKSENAAWHSVPSWYLVAADDQTIPPAAQRHMADRAGARTTEVGSSHAVAVSHPVEVTRVITNAAQATAGK